MSISLFWPIIKCRFTNMRLIFHILTFSILFTAIFSGCDNSATDNGYKKNLIDTEILDFTLEEISVSVGTTIVWTNLDYKTHTTTSGIPPDKSGLWDSPFLDENEEFRFKFTAAGEFPYWCRVHPFMIATIIVED